MSGLRCSHRPLAARWLSEGESLLPPVGVAPLLGGAEVPDGAEATGSTRSPSESHRLGKPEARP